MNQEDTKTEPWSGLLPELVRRPLTGLTAVSAVAITVYVWLGNDSYPLVVNSKAVSSEPWRLVTSTLLHNGYLHLIFNLYWLVQFGKFLEPKFGAWRTAALYLLLSAVSSMAEYAFDVGGVGLSGVVYGVFGMRWVLARAEPANYEMDPKETRLFIAWFFLCIVLTRLEILNIGNVAHFTGAVTGAMVGGAMVAEDAKRRFWVAGITVASIGLLATASVAREKFNFGGSEALFSDAYEAGDDGNPGLAAERYSRGLELDPDAAWAWFNLGIATSELGRNEEALAAFKRAYELSSENEDYRPLFLEMLEVNVEEAIKNEQFERAADSYREIEELGEMRADDWHSFGFALEQIERNEGAFAAYRKAVELNPTVPAYQESLSSLAERLETDADADSNGKR